MSLPLYIKHVVMNTKMDIAQLEDKINKIEKEYSNTFRVYKEVISLCREHLFNLRCKVVKQGFLNEKDEIYFFKNTMQAPLTKLIYYSELQTFEANFPVTNVKAQKKFIKTKNKELINFFYTHNDFVKYVKLEHNHFDKHYYTRKHSNLFYDKNLMLYNFDQVFSTSHNRLLARINAYKSLVVYLQKRLKQLNGKVKQSKLQWTSSKASLTELIYALFYSKAINNGDVDIKQIAIAMQDSFGVDLGDFYHTYSEIRSRKKNRIKFLNQISATLSNKMKMDDA